MVKAKESFQKEHDDITPTGEGRPVIHGTQGVVSAGHYLTSIAAMRMLLSGGNAFDAAVAAGFTAAVVEPIASYSLAAEVTIMLYHSASGQLRVLSGQGVAGSRATVDLFKKKGLDKIPTGPGPNAELSFTVPGVVDALLTMLETYGTKTVGEAMAPALEYAERGFPMYKFMRRRLRQPETLQQFKLYPPGGTGVFFEGDQPLAVGRMVVQKHLAATLNKLAQAERDAAGHRAVGIKAAREMFYEGEVARTIVQCSDRTGGLLDLEDLANYRSSFEEPIATTFMGHKVHAQSTWTQGAVLLQALNMLEHFDLRVLGHNTPQYIHTITEALNLAFADRERYYGDPNFATVPIEGLLSKEYAAARSRLINSDRSFPEMPDAGDPGSYGTAVSLPDSTSAVLTAPSAQAGGYGGEDGTTHYAVIDREGNMVCATPSGGVFAKSVFFPELGCTLSTRSEMFFVDEQHPNGLQPGKRPRTTLVNYLVSKDGQPVMTIGCPGGDNQAQANLQLILNVLVFGMDPQQAVEAPRFASGGMVNSFYPREYLPGQLNVDPGISMEARSKLESMGHKVVEVPTCGLGAIVTQRDPDTGILSASGDPRRTTYAIGY